MLVYIRILSNIRDWQLNVTEQTVSMDVAVKIVARSCNSTFILYYVAFSRRFTGIVPDPVVILRVSPKERRHIMWETIKTSVNLHSNYDSHQNMPKVWQESW